MAGRNAVFVDLSNFNVLYKVGDKFTLALNYSQAVDRFCETLAVLGPGYDVYLCLKPRGAGEGDLVIDEISMSGMPFTVDSEELYRVLKFFRESNGVSEVYLCNWLNNYVETARVASFESAFYYGDRVLYIEVKERMINGYRLFNNQIEFTSVVGDGFEGYGDLGLLDVDGLRAQYGEFNGVGKREFTGLAPLIHCYRTQCKMPTLELYEDLVSIRSGQTDTRHVRPATKPEPVKREKKEAPIPPPDDDIEEALDDYTDVKVKKRLGLGVFGALLLVLTFIATFAIGYSVAYLQKTVVTEKPQSYYEDIDWRVQQLAKVQSVYAAGETATFEALNALDYATKSGVGVDIVGFERYPSYYIVRCTCASEDVVTSFVDYLDKSYVVETPHDLGVTTVDGVQMLHYSITFSQGG